MTKKRKNILIITILSILLLVNTIQCSDKEKKNDDTENNNNKELINENSSEEKTTDNSDEPKKEETLEDDFNTLGFLKNSNILAPKKNMIVEKRSKIFYNKYKEIYEPLKKLSEDTSLSMTETESMLFLRKIRITNNEFKTIDLFKEVYGAISLLYFWSIENEKDRTNLKSLSEMLTENLINTKIIKVFAIYVGDNYSNKEVINFLNENKIKVPVYFMQDETVNYNYKESKKSITIILSPDGRALFSSDKAINWKTELGIHFFNMLSSTVIE